LNSEDDIDVMADGESNVRDYEIGDCVQIKNKGVGRIAKIIYLLLDEDNEVHCCRKSNLGGHTSFNNF